MTSIQAGTSTDLVVECSESSRFTEGTPPRAWRAPSGSSREGARWSLGLRFGICKKNNDLVNNVMIVIAVLFLPATIMVTIS